MTGHKIPSTSKTWENLKGLVHKMQHGECIDLKNAYQVNKFKHALKLAGYKSIARKIGSVHRCWKIDPQQEK